MATHKRNKSQISSERTYPHGSGHSSFYDRKEEKMLPAMTIATPHYGPQLIRICSQNNPFSVEEITLEGFKNKV